MEISFLQIQNFKSIENMILRDIGSALILVGQKKALYMAIHKDGGDRRNSLLGKRLSALFSYSDPNPALPEATNQKEVS